MSPFGPSPPTGSGCEASISELQANGESVLWNGIQGAAGVLQANPDTEAQPTVVVITGSGSFASLTTASGAVGTLRNAGAPVYAIGLEGDRLDTGGLQDVVTRAGGRLVTTPDSEQLDELGTEMAQAIDQQYVLAYEPPTGDDAGAVADIQLQVGDATTSASFVRGSQTHQAGRPVRPDRHAATATACCRATSPSTSAWSSSCSPPGSGPSP